mgnify:FL=1|jgi:hypothetical protein
MKAVLEFNLPEDGDDFRHAINGEQYFIALHNIREDVRQIWKYNSLPEEQFDLVDRIYQMINQRINEASKAND